MNARMGYHHDSIVETIVSLTEVSQYFLMVETNLCSSSEDRYDGEHDDWGLVGS